MNFFSRAIKNVTRKWSKSVLLALTFFVIGNFVIVGLGVSDAATQAKVLTRQKMRAVINYQVDYQKFYEWVESLTPEEQEEAYSKELRITQEEIDALLVDPRVSVLNALSTRQLYSGDFDAVPLNNKNEENGYGGGQECWIDESGKEVCSTYVEPNLMLRANAFPNMIEIVDGMYTIVDGRMYTKEEIDSGALVCLITDTLAEYNNLRVGDKITVYIESPSEFEGDGWYARMGLTKEDVALELEIIGIFDNADIAENDENFDWMNKWQSPENIVLMPDTTYAESQMVMQNKSWDYYASQSPDDEYYQNEENRPNVDWILNKTSITVLLNDPLVVDEFVEDYTPTDEGTFILLDANNDTFNKLSRPLDTLSLFAKFIVILVIFNAIVIITLTTALTLKTREYEVGVLLAQGVTKFKIVAQFFVELSIVAIVGFTLSVLSGMMIAKQVGTAVLDYQVDLSGVKDETDNENPWMWYGDDNDYFTDIELDDIVENYEVNISPLIIAEIYVAGLGIVLVSILIPSLMIMRFNPKRILMSAQ